MMSTRKGVILKGVLGIFLTTLIVSITAFGQNWESSLGDIPLSENGHSPFVNLAKRVTPAVVNISAEKVTKIEAHQFEFKGPFEEFFKRFFQFPPPLEEKRHVLGSGFIFKKKKDTYYIMTNNHVIEGAEKIIIRLSDKTEYRGKAVSVVGKDAKTDIAVLKLKTKKELPVLELGNSDSIYVGDWVMAVGNPFGLERTVTVLSLIHI